MSKLLYVNACVRTESRTNRLAGFVLDHLRKEAAVEVEELRLAEEQVAPLSASMLRERNERIEKREFSHPSFRYARQFAEADMIVIAAPYWDLSFPAILKAYFERINVTELTFRYREDGSVQGLCHAKKLIYVTTAGGPVFEPNGGYTYTRQLAEYFWGIPETVYYKAEGLDMVGADVEGILREAEAGIE